MPSQIYYIEALAALPNHLGVVQHDHLIIIKRLLVWIKQHRKYVVPFFVLSFDCISLIVVFYVPVVLHV